MQAENLLKIKKVEYRALKLDKDYTRERLDEALESQGLPPARSFPVITRDDEVIGGLNELKVAIAQGKL